MSEDLYTAWLKLPPAPRPVDYYTLLGLKRFCADMPLIENSARRQLTELDKYTLHSDHAKRNQCQNMMDEVALARCCLVKPSRKKKYDDSLAQKLNISLPETSQLLDDFDEVEENFLASTGGAIVQFEEMTRMHLKKWNLNSQEERLLFAEARAMGVPDDLAGNIISRVDGEISSYATDRGQKIARRLMRLTVGFVLIAIAVIVLHRVYSFIGETRFDTQVEQARKCIEENNIPGAESALHQAKDISPDSPILANLRAEIEAKRKRIKEKFDDALLQAITLIDAGNLSQAQKKIHLAEKIFPNDPKLAGIKRKLEKKQK